MMWVCKLNLKLCRRAIACAMRGCFADGLYDYRVRVARISAPTSRHNPCRLLPSASAMFEPAASLINMGVRPTARNARTGLLTPLE